MRCPSCKSENREGARFCVACGAGVGFVCQVCQNFVAPEAKFCDNCGTALPLDDRPPAMPEVQLHDVERRARENVVDIRSAIEGERKQVTVLFADLVDSTRLIELMDAEESAAITEPCLDAMMACVRRYQGTITRVMGDGIVALFGAPVAQEDHAIRACYAALDIQRSMNQLAASSGQATDQGPKARVGLNSGDVVVKALGDDLHVDYDAIGMPVHMASRMEKAASPGSIYLTAQTLALTQNAVDVEPLGPLALKGVSEPVPAFRLIGPKPGRSRFVAASARGLSNLVGRDNEIATLQKALDRVAKGTGQIVAAVGEPGIGKSRFYHEFVHSPRTQDALVLECNAVSFRTSNPWAPIIDLLRGYFEIEDDDDVSDVIDKVTTRLATLDETLKPAVAALCSLLGVDSGDKDWNALESYQRRGRTQQAIKGLLLRESVNRSVVLVIEDLHWADEATLQLIETLLESLASNRLLILVNYRPEFEHSWGNRSVYTQIRVEPLDSDEADDLLDLLLGDDPSLVRLKRMIAEQAEGNALFLEEMVQSLVEAGRLVGRRGAFRSEGDTELLGLPTTIQALIAARIDRLELAEKKLLFAAAVIGFEFSQPLLLAVSGQSESSFDSNLSRLKSIELIHEKQLFPETLYAFKHALIHDVAFKSLLKSQRRRLHARVGEAIERLYPARRIELAETMATHFADGEIWTKAIENYLQAAQTAKAQYAIDHAIELCHQGLACAEYVADQADSQRSFLVLLGDLFSQQDDISEANLVYERALQVTDNASERRRIENKVHRQGVATRENGHVAFYRHGNRGKTILFSSPISYGNGPWHPLIERLCQHFRLITVDSRGTGASSPLAPNWTLVEDLEDVRATIETLGGESVTVVGLSHTGAMAVRLAAVYPHLVERLVVIGGTFGKAEAGGDTSEYLQWAIRLREMIDSGNYQGAVRRVFEEVMPQPEMLELREVWVREATSNLPVDVFCNTLLDLQSEIDCEPFAKDVRVPTLVVHGTDDLSVPYAHGVYLASIIPGAIFYPFLGRGHEPEYSATAEFCDVLSEFVLTGTVAVSVPGYITPSIA